MGEVIDGLFPPPPGIDERETIRRIANRLARLQEMLDKGAPRIIINNERRMVFEAAAQLPHGTIHYTATPGTVFYCGTDYGPEDNATEVAKIVSCPRCLRLLITEGQIRLAPPPS